MIRKASKRSGRRSSAVSERIENPALQAAECPECRKLVAEKALTEHQAEHRRVRRTLSIHTSLCPICKKRLAPDRYLDHYQSEHGSFTAAGVAVMRKCSVCGVSLRQGTVWTHKQMEHGDSKGHVHGQRRTVAGGVGKVPYAVLEQSFYDERRDLELDTQEIESTGWGRREADVADIEVKNGSRKNDRKPGARGVPKAVNWILD